MTTIDILEVYQVSKDHPLTIHPVGQWSPRKPAKEQSEEGSFSVETNTNGALWKRRRNLQSALVTAVVVVPPSKTERNASSKGTRNGFKILWQEVERLLNCTTRYVTVVDFFPGGQFLNGSWNGALKTLMEGRGDVGLVGLPVLAPAAYHVDFTVGIKMFGYKMFFHDKFAEELDLFKFLRPYEATLWITIAGTLLAIGMALSVAWHAEGRHTEGGDYWTVLGECVLTSFSAFCQQGHHRLPRLSRARGVYLLAFLVGVVLVSVYSSRITSILSVRRRVLPFETLPQMMAAPGYRLHVVDGTSTSNVFQESNDPLIKSYRQEGSDISISMDRTLDYVCGVGGGVHNKSSVVLASSGWSRTILDGAQCPLVVVRSNYFRHWVAMPIRRGFPYHKVVDYNLHRLNERGIIQRYLTSLSKPASLGVAAKPAQLPKVSLNDVGSIFLLLSVGMLVAWTILLGERIVHYLVEERVLPPLPFVH